MAERSPHTLTRSTFSTSRLAEFASVKELTTQTGHDPADWPTVIIKELVDNGIDAAELAEVAPEIAIVVNGTGITVTDNGGGISPEGVTRMLDFSRRVSSNEAYVSPTRGRQGNALQTILAMPFVLDGTSGETVIESRGIKHTVTFTIDAVQQVPIVTTEQEPGNVHSGTSITVRWPVSASSKLIASEAEIVQIAENFAAFNPHLSIALSWGDEVEVGIEAADPAWSKWLPGMPTSAHWYDIERFNRLIAATVANDQGNDRETLVREFVASFRGMARSETQKLVLDKTHAARMTLAELFNEGRNKKGVAALLQSLKDNTEPVKPANLGVIGREHLAIVCIEAGGDEETFGYYKETGVTGSLPWVLEVAFAYCPGDDAVGRRITGCNWSAAIHNPFHDLNEWLANQDVDRFSPVIVIAHLACPMLSFADRGKSKLLLPEQIDNATEAAAIKITARWAKQMKQEIRSGNARHRRDEAMRRAKRIYQNDAVYEALPAAYAKVSDNGKLYANARQIYYALRNEVEQKTGKKLRDSYLTQTLLPDYIAETGVQWKIAYDDRGHLTEPHTGKEIGLGTLAVADYLAGRKPPQIMEAAMMDAHVLTSGPAGNFGALLYVEKEGFDSLIESVQLRERFDIAIMSCKGMSVTAARSLAENICGARGIPLFALHDFDKAALSIASTLSRDTRRYQFEHKVDVIDIGLRMKDGARPDDIAELNLMRFSESHSDIGTAEARRENMRLNGATEQEIAFLLKQRIELNALTSAQFIRLIERKLTAHGVKKLVPGVKLLNATYRAVIKGEMIRQSFEDAVDEVAEEMKSVSVPDTIADQVEAMLKKEPTLRWDAAVARIVRKGGK
jgi:DNA topoisomerase VI subunit B